MRIEPASVSATPDLTDRQWYLSGAPGDPHLNLGGITTEYDGSGVTVGIWDDGIQYNHPDLKHAYDKSLHLTFEGRVHDPEAVWYDSKHGTAVAGIIAAADDGLGTTGIAPGVTFAVTDILSDRSNVSRLDTLHGLSKFDVTNHSWGYTYSWDVGPWDRIWRKHLEKDLINSTTNGRDGLGTVNVFAAGNDGMDWLAYNTNVSAATETHHGIAVAALNARGNIAEFSTPGSTVLVSAFGRNIWTTDRTGWEGYSIFGSRNDYTVFGGTSAATPQVSAIAALMLEANPNLGWRDVQTILAASARHTGSLLEAGKRGHESDDWDFNSVDHWNGGGMHYSNDYGYGLVDAHAAVRMAETWNVTSTSRNLVSEVEDSWEGSESLRANSPVEIKFSVDNATVTEMASVDLSFENGELDAYRIVLVSPGGTRSILTKPTQYFAEVDDWRFSSREFLGENSLGEWTMIIQDVDDAVKHDLLKSADLTISGASDTENRTLIYTNEFSYLADGYFGHTDRITSQNGTYDTLNAAAVTTNTVLDFAEGTGRIDRVDVKLPDSFASIFTGDGNDRITGSGTDERIVSMRGADRLSGGNGNDTLEGGAGRDMLQGEVGRDRLMGGTGSDNLKGGRDQDRLVGNRGADTLSGGSGNDGLTGGRGSDILRDGSGSDTMRGGLGADTFVLTTDTNTDYVTDFENKSDIIQLEGFRWSDLDVTERNSDTWAVRYDEDLLLVSGQTDDFTGVTRSDFLFT